MKNARVVPLINIEMNTCCILDIKRWRSLQESYLHTKECSVQTRKLIQHLNDVCHPSCVCDLNK